MNIILITPARASSRSGNRTTAVRWGRLLRELGHRVHIAMDYRGEQADLMIALHAWRSADAIRDFRRAYPQRPLIVALTGTDIYHYIDHDSVRTLRSLAFADRLVGLQELARQRLPKRYRSKFRVIHQSAPPISRRAKTRNRAIDIAVIGQLRQVKDPLRAAKAARHLPRDSRIRVIHLGGAETQRWANAARAEMKANPRYVWHGERPGAEVRRLLGRAQALVLSSQSEGGANVISEAVAANVPVLASRIDGSVGLLGSDYPGYFPVGDTKALTRLLQRAETDRDFLSALRRAVARRAHYFTRSRERAAWKLLLEELIPSSRTRRRRRMPRQW
ncbi:MAG: TIGR04348 family glycosyltransferase [Rhizobiales bacterium]|nr:TIGR04348 family glycosyltransferase [Hyphomicrobiales bacterium]